MRLARFIKFSGSHKFNDRWAPLGSVGLENGSVFEDANISTERGSQKIPLNWDDTWKFAAGVHYRPVDKWLLQLGFAYDTSPVDDADKRTPDLPLDRQNRIGTGIQYDWNEDVTVGVAYEYLDLGKAEIDQSGGPLQGPLKGEYDPNAIHFFAFNLIWKF